jgi:hypothetical protein
MYREYSRIRMKDFRIRRQRLNRGRRAGARVYENSSRELCRALCLCFRMRKGLRASLFFVSTRRLGFPATSVAATTTGNAQ